MRKRERDNKEKDRIIMMISWEAMIKKQIQLLRERTKKKIVEEECLNERQRERGRENKLSEREA